MLADFKTVACKESAIVDLVDFRTRVLGVEAVEGERRCFLGAMVMWRVLQQRGAGGYWEGVCRISTMKIFQSDIELYHRAKAILLSLS